MPWSGSGTYSLPPAYSPEVNGTTIDAARYNGLTSDVATGITACLAKNGENVPTANLPMGGFKHTGAAAGAASGEYLIYAQTIVAAAGAAATPGFAFTGDLNNGWWAPAADTQAWSVSGTEYMRLTSTQWTLQTNAVLSNGGTARRTMQFTNTGGDLYAGIENSTGGGIFTGSSAYAGVLGTSNATALELATNGTVRASITSAGIVGIGVTGTQGLLDVAGGIRSTTGINVTGNGGFFNAANKFGVDQNSGASRFYASGADTSTRGSFEFHGISSNGSLDNIWFNITNDGRLYGTALHNNAGAVTGATNQYIASGTYTPTATNVTNAPSCSVSECQWMRVGNTVMVSGAVTTGTLSAAAPTTTQIGISLPIASNFTVISDLAGVMGFNTSWNSCDVFADITNDRATLDFVANTTTGLTRSFMFFYEIK